MGNLHSKAMAGDEMIRRIWQDVKDRREEIYVAGFKESFALFLKRLSPSLLNRILKNSNVT